MYKLSSSVYVFRLVCSCKRVFTRRSQGLASATCAHFQLLVSLLWEYKCKDMILLFTKQIF